jgi:signal transduction histidine kinase
VSDRGRGYDAATARAGVGLRSMRDRVERLGGTLAIDGAPGRGTTVTVTLPLERAG